MSLSNVTIDAVARPFADGGGPPQSVIDAIWRDARALRYLGEGNKQQRVIQGLRALRDGRKGAAGEVNLAPDRDKLRAVAADLAERLVKLELVAEEDVAEALEGAQLDRPAPASGADRKVFVVHGHGDRRHAVARVLEKLKLVPVILDERANKGRWIIEKFEQESRDAVYAVVILAPDDRGAGPGESVPREPNRARQNVILEFGYFMAALGRELVAALYVPGVQLPSDIEGVGHIELSEGWELRLAGELVAAGIDVDLNNLA